MAGEMKDDDRQNEKVEATEDKVYSRAELRQLSDETLSYLVRRHFENAVLEFARNDRDHFLAVCKERGIAGALTASDAWLDIDELMDALEADENWTRLGLEVLRRLAVPDIETIIGDCRLRAVAAMLGLNFYEPEGGEEKEDAGASKNGRESGGPLKDTPTSYIQ